MIALEQIRAARAMLGLKQRELAQKAGVSTGTLNNIERGVQKDPKFTTIRALQRALEDEGIEFLEDGNGGIGLMRRMAKAAKGPTTILIIDDNLADRKLYSAWLNKQPNKNYKIVEAGNAKEGYEAFIQHTPACIVLDFMMYGTDGFQLLVEMKKEHTRIPPIVFISATPNEAIKRDVLALGAHGYLDKKSLTREKLYETIAKALR